MTIEEINEWIDHLIELQHLCSVRPYQSQRLCHERNFEREIKEATEKLKEAIIEYGRESAAEAFELGRKSAKEHVT
jgi:hypothetical protein